MLHILIYKANVMSEIYPEDSAKSCSKLNIRIDDPTLIMPVHRSLTVHAKKKVWTTTTVRNHVKRQILDNKNYFSSKLFLFFHTRFWFEAEFYFFPFFKDFLVTCVLFPLNPDLRNLRFRIIWRNHGKRTWKPRTGWNDEENFESWSQWRCRSVINGLISTVWPEYDETSTKRWCVEGLTYFAVLLE